MIAFLIYIVLFSYTLSDEDYSLIQKTALCMLENGYDHVTITRPKYFLSGLSANHPPGENRDKPSFPDDNFLINISASFTSYAYVEIPKHDAYKEAYQDSSIFYDGKIYKEKTVVEFVELYFVDPSFDTAYYTNNFSKTKHQSTLYFFNKSTEEYILIDRPFVIISSNVDLIKMTQYPLSPGTIDNVLDVSYFEEGVNMISFKNGNAKLQHRIDNLKDAGIDPFQLFDDYKQKRDILGEMNILKRDSIGRSTFNYYYYFKNEDAAIAYIERDKIVSQQRMNSEDPLYRKLIKRLPQIKYFRDGNIVIKGSNFRKKSEGSIAK
jgi:hypothetical protein